MATSPLTGTIELVYLGPIHIGCEFGKFAEIEHDKFSGISCVGKSTGWLSNRVLSVLDSGAEGPGFKSQS